MNLAKVLQSPLNCLVKSQVHHIPTPFERIDPPQQLQLHRVKAQGSVQDRLLKPLHLKFLRRPVLVHRLQLLLYLIHTNG